MDSIDTWTNVATLIGIPISLIGLLFAYLSLKKGNKEVTKQINNTQTILKETNVKIQTFTDIVNLQLQYSSGRDQYHNCKVITNAQNAEAIENSFKKGALYND